MTFEPHKDPILKNAYKVYFSEAKQHLNELKGIFVDENKPLPEVLRVASTRFHTLKGGAGFFGLTEISKVSGFLEKKIIEPDFNFLDSKNEVVEKFLTLKKLIEEMPEPESD